MLKALLVAVVCCCFCTELIVDANQIVLASEYDTFLKSVQHKMNLGDCGRYEAQRIPQQTLYKKYQADCSRNDIPFRLLILQTIRRESKFGVLNQADIDELHQEMLHYLLLKNSQLLLFLLHQEHSVTEDVGEIRTFHKYLFEYYGQLFLPDLYRTTLDAFLIVWHDNPTATKRLVDYMYIIYRKNIEGTFEPMVNALIYLAGKLGNVGEHHLRDTLREITKNDLYYQLEDKVVLRIEQIIEQTLPIHNAQQLVESIVTKFQDESFLENMECVTKDYMKLPVTQDIYTEALKKVWTFLYSNADLKNQLVNEIKQYIDQSVQKDTPIYNAAYWIEFILLKWHSAQIVESTEGITSTYRHLTDNYPMPFLLDVFKGIVQHILDRGYYRSVLSPKWVSKFLQMTYQPGNVETFKLMAALLVYSHQVHSERLKSELHFGYYFHKITKDNFYSQLDTELKSNISKIVHAMPPLINTLYFAESFYLKNQAYPSIITDNGSNFIAAFYNNENNEISSTWSRSADVNLIIKVTLQSSSRPELYLSSERDYKTDKLRVEPINSKSFFVVNGVDNDSDMSYKALQFRVDKEYLCCDDKWYAEPRKTVCAISWYHDYNIDKCWWSFETQ